MNQPSRSWTEAAQWLRLRMTLPPILGVMPLVPLAVRRIVAAIRVVNARVASSVAGFSSVRGMLALPIVIRAVGIAAENNTDAGYITAKRLVVTVAVEIVAALTVSAQVVVAVQVEQIAILTDIIAEMLIGTASTLDVAAMETGIIKGDSVPAAT